MTPKKSLTLLALATILAGSVATIALAERMHGQDAMPMLKFDEIDADKDGKVTAEEFAAYRTAEFTKADTNADGQLNAEELAARHLAEMTARAADMSAKMIDRMDANGDGLVSAEELENGPRPVSMFERLDTDYDGAISKDEAAAMMKMKGRHHGRFGHKG